MYTPTGVSHLPHTLPPITGFRFSPEQARLLRQVFPGLDEVSLFRLAGMARERVLPAGAVLCHEGQVENTFYIISSGRVLISQQLERDTSRILAYRGPGELIGEMALLLEDHPRMADVTTLEPTTVLEIDRKAFQQLLQESPSVVLTILRTLAARQRESDQRTIADLRQKYTALAEAYRRLKAETTRRSEFLTTVAHELRTPLTVIKGYLALMRTGVMNGEALEQAFQTITLNFDTIMRLVNNILLLQEIALITPQFQPLNLNTLLGHLIDAVQASPGFPANLTIRAELAADRSVMGDASSLTHAFGAILDNAIKFSPGGGEIVVRAGLKDSQVYVQVRDPGIGIAPEVLPHIFDHFHHLDTAGAHVFGGIGLGLPLVKAVIEQHHGTIQVESEPGRGSTFTITL